MLFTCCDGARFGLGARRLRRHHALVASATEPRSASRPFGFDRVALKCIGSILRCVIDAQDTSSSFRSPTSTDRPRERHAWNADLVRAVHNASLSKSRQRSKECERPANAIDHALGRSRVSRAEERFDTAEVLRGVVGDADLHSDRPKISLSSCSVANSPRSACVIAWCIQSVHR